MSIASDRLIENEFAAFEDEFPQLAPDSPEEAQRFLIRFNREIERLIEEYDLETVGETIWELYGLTDLGRSALDPRVRDGFQEFYASLEDLYRSFARHCENRPNANQSGRFSSACFMLWDMDSGLIYLSFKDGPSPLVEGLFDFGLAHDHAAVQKSFLHGLGHQHRSHPDFVMKKIDRFLLRCDLSPEIRDYAWLCRTGNMM